MAWLALGLGALLLALWLLRLFAAAEAATVRRAGTGVLAVLGGLVVAWLLLSGRGGQVWFALVLFGPALWRRWQAWRAGRGFAAAPGESAVETATLELRLDHASGTMRGRVRRGPFEGRELAELGLPELLSLLEACQAEDPESVPLLEAWLDRAAPDWRDSGAPPPASGAMTRAEALAVLGLSAGADAAAIRAAHRRLMRTAHPDGGGSDWLAARVNQARDILLE